MQYPVTKLLLVHPDSIVCASFTKRFAGLPRVEVVQGLFEDLPPHDCFVTAGNAFGIMTAGIDAAVIQHFGVQLMNAVQTKILDDYLGEQPVGTAFVLPTGDSKIPFVAHAPTMRVPGSIIGTDKVYAATWAALTSVYQHNKVNEVQICTIAFPAMGTGFGAMEPEEAARQMAVAYRHYLSPPPAFDWDMVADRHKAICYDGRSQVAK